VTDVHIVTVLYGHPTDPDAFDAYYRDTHAPLVEAISVLKGFTARKVASLDENPPPYHLIAELSFDSAEDLQAGMGSAEGQAAAADVPHFATGGVTMFLAHD
jgi:uncharacterized protein (TIGR02118 family)